MQAIDGQLQKVLIHLKRCYFAHSAATRPVFPK